MAIVPQPALKRPPWQTSRLNTPTPLVALAGDAKSYLLGVAGDLNFTRALPPANPDVSTAALQAQLARAAGHADADVAELLRVGSDALVSGRFTIATSAFSAAADAAPHDWRGPYFEGLAERALGNGSRARVLFSEAAIRVPRPEAYTSLALEELEIGNTSAALADASRAADLDASYEPARFAAGMIALVAADQPVAERNLAAALRLGGAPSRTQYFLDALTGGQAAAPQ